MLILESRARPADSDLAVAGGGDDRFGIGIAVTFYSLLANLPENSRVFLYVLDGGISDATKARFHGIFERMPQEIHLRYLTVDVSQYARLKTPKHLTVMTYLRLALPDLLPDLARVLYIDTDLVIHRNLLDLWNEPMDGAPAVGVREYGYNTLAMGLPMSYQQFGLPAEGVYCNAGVMLMNLERWRRDRIHNRVVDYSIEYAHTIQCGDQDGINAVIAGTWKVADPRWNVQVGSVLNIRFLPPSPYRDEIAPHVKNWLKDPFILHFMGRKPWDGGFLNPARPLFVSYLERSGWMSANELTEWHREWRRRCVQDLTRGLGNKVLRRI